MEYKSVNIVHMDIHMDRAPMFARSITNVLMKHNHLGSTMPDNQVVHSSVFSTSNFEAVLPVLQHTSELLHLV